MEIKESKISEEMLKNLGVYELRELARTLGVVSPTTKKRGELCSEILTISSGEVKAEPKQNNKGRPPKSVTKISNIVEEFIPQSILNLQKPVANSYSSILKLAQAPSLLINSNCEKVRQIYGYVNSVNNDFYLINLKNVDLFKSMVFYVSNEIVEKFNLQLGDKIVATGKTAENANCGLIDEIISINNVNIENWNPAERKKLNINNCELPTKKTFAFGNEIKMGERTIMFSKTADDAMFSILNEIQDNEILKDEKLVFLGVEVSPEIIYYGKTKEDLEMFATSYYNSLEDSHNAVINAINHCNSLLKDGYNVRLFVFDAYGILTRLDQHFATEKGEYFGHKTQAVQLVKTLVGSGKAVYGGPCLTTTSICFENEKDDNFIKTELLKIAKII